MSIFVCFAVREEAHFFSRQAKNRAGLKILLTGIGCRNAERALRSALTQCRPGMVITSGFAGGLDPALVAGTVVVDADEGFSLRPALIAAGAREGQFHCADHVVVTDGEKAKLWHSTGAHAVEMESSVIRSICKDRSIPSATVRVISDAAHESLPLDFNQFLTADFEMNFLKLLRAIVLRPGCIGGLLRFQKQVRGASQTLARTLLQALESQS